MLERFVQCLIIFIMGNLAFFVRLYIFTGERGKRFLWVLIILNIAFFLFSVLYILGIIVFK